LSIYQNFYAGTKLVPDIDNEYRIEYHENGGGENVLALITGCHWIEQKEASELELNNFYQGISQCGHLNTCPIKL
jgi:hypothetical protein